jgi:hypothetical protein
MAWGALRPIPIDRIVTETLTEKPAGRRLKHVFGAKPFNPVNAAKSGDALPVATFDEARTSIDARRRWRYGRSNFDAVSVARVWGRL